MFKNFVKRIFKNLLNDNSFSSMTGGYSSGTPLVNNMNPKQLLASNKNWVYVATDKLADTISGIELKLKKYNAKGDDVEVITSNILDVLNKPNSAMTGRDLIYSLIGHWELVGNAYWLKDKPQNPTQLLPLDPSCVKPVLSQDKTQVIAYEYMLGTKAVKYEADLIVHLKYPSMTNPLRGAGTLQHVAEWVDVEGAATEFNRLFFLNGASVSGVLETEATSEEAMLLAKKGWEMRNEGMGNAHKTAVLGKGSKYTATSATPRDMQFSELDNRYRDKILSAFGVPKSVIGIVEDVNRASAEASYYVFMKFTIDPKMKRLVAYLNEYLLPSFSNADSLYFDYDNIIPDNDDLRLRENYTGLAGQSYLTINEVRAREGLPPIDNGDYVYGGFSTTPIGKPQLQPVQNTLDDATAKSKKPKTSKNALAAKKQSIVDEITSKAFGSTNLLKKTKEALDEAEHKAFIVRVDKYEKMFIKAIADFDKKLEEQVLKELEDGNKSYQTKDVFNAEQAQNLFIGFTSKILQDLIKAEGQAQMERLNTTEPFNPMNESIQNKLKKLLNLTSQSYTDTTLKLLNTELQAATSNGESLAEIKQRVANVFSLSEQYRAERVARTTVFGVANNAAREAYKQSGVVTEVAWHTAEDELVCEYCGPMNGKVIAVDESFFKEGQTVTGRDGGKMKLDFDTVEDPPLHANCRCFTKAETIEVTRAATQMMTKAEEEMKTPEADTETKVLQEIFDSFND